MARNWLMVCVFALTALRLATETVRIASAARDWALGIDVASPERTERAALSASSDLTSPSTGACSDPAIDFENLNSLPA
jgi:hypothetical protein